MTEQEAERVLSKGNVVEVAKANMQDIKRMREQCLTADIPAMMTRPCTTGKS